jgi:hypothetical protein
MVFNKLGAENFSNRLNILDDLVHERLGEGGLIKLIVTEFTVTN